MPPLGLSTRAGRQNTQLHCYGSFTGCASQSESSSGCVFWHTIVCTAQHRRTCLTACGRHQRSSLVDVSALLTPRHYKCRRLVGLPLATSATRDSGLLLTFDISEGDQNARSLRMPALRPASQAGPMRNPREGTSGVLRDTIRLTWCWYLPCSAYKHFFSGDFFFFSYACHLP